MTSFNNHLSKQGVLWIEDSEIQSAHCINCCSFVIHKETQTNFCPVGCDGDDDRWW
jgi:hypothetical protein